MPRAVLIASAVAACACGSRSGDIDRWGEVERAAEPLVAEADPSELLGALALVETGEEAAPVSDGAIERLVVWADVEGGLAVWQGDQLADERYDRLGAMARIGLAAIDRGDGPALAAARYLGYRMRAEGNILAEITLGMRLARRASEREGRAGDGDTAPSEAEIRRALAVEATSGRVLAAQMTAELGARAMVVDSSLRRFFQALVVDLPVERDALIAHVDATVERFSHDPIVEPISGSLGDSVREMYRDLELAYDPRGVEAP